MVRVQVLGDRWISKKLIIIVQEITMNTDNLYEETIKAASELYERSGRVEGRDLDNWLEAERIVKEGEQFSMMFMQLLMQDQSSTSKVMEAIKLLVELEQKK